MIKAKVTLIEELEDGTEREVVKDKIIFPAKEETIPQELFFSKRIYFCFHTL